MNNAGAGLLILALSDPLWIKAAERRQDRGADPRHVTTIGSLSDLVMKGGAWLLKCLYLAEKSLCETSEHCGSTCQYNI